MENVGIRTANPNIGFEILGFFGHMYTVGFVNDFQTKESGFLENYWMKSCKDFGDTHHLLFF